MRKIEIIASTALAVAAWQAVARAEEDALRLELISDARAVCTFEPLLIKMVITNGSRSNRKVFQPSRDTHTLQLYLEHRDGGDEYFRMVEAESIVGATGEPLAAVLKPQQRLVTYVLAFRDVDGDYYFRHRRSYRIYATLKTPTGLVKSPSIMVRTHSREKREHENDLIQKEYRTLRWALNPQAVHLFDPKTDPHLDPRTIAEKLAALESVRDTLTAGYLKVLLVWRIELLKVKYSSEMEQLAARQRLEEIRPTLKEPGRDLLSLLLARVNLEQGRLEAAAAELDRVPDDSPQKGQLLQIISRAEK